jgi:hypothetical protein
LAQADLNADLAATFEPVAINETIVDALNCTAVFRAMALLMGSDSDAATTFHDREGYMAALAGMMWVADEANAEQTPEQVYDILLPPINTATGQYLGHMEQLSTTTDAPFDDLIIGAVEFCNSIYATLQETQE